MTRCGCCGGRAGLVVRGVRVTAWGRVSSVLVCRTCDLTPDPVQAPLHERDAVQSGGTRCVRCGRTTRPDSDVCRFHANQVRG